MVRAGRDSGSEYPARMHGVLAHIGDHLDEPLELEPLASVANFSPFHFHRLFTAWMGETLGDYMHRRLEMAALRLVAQPRLQVLEVALSVASDRPKRSRAPSRLDSGAHRQNGDDSKSAIVIS